MIFINTIILSFLCTFYFSANVLTKADYLKEQIDVEPKDISIKYKHEEDSNGMIKDGASKKSKNKPMTNYVHTMNQTNDSSSRIVNGVEVDPPHKYPFQVRFPGAGGGGYHTFCGGTLIAGVCDDPDDYSSCYSEWVLTAAHCLTPSVAILGEHDVYEYDQAETYKLVLDAIPHPGYGNGPNYLSHDLALVKEGVDEFALF